MSSLDRARIYSGGSSSASGAMIPAAQTLDGPTGHRSHINYVLWLTTNFFKGLYAATGLLLIAGFTYLLGHPILEGAIVGNDSAYALSIISWINQWFPELPNWYPLQGAGASSIVQYPYASHYLVVIAHRLLGLSIFEAFRVAQILSIVLTAWGVYLLVWAKIRSQTAALIAGIFYPLSFAVWSWVTDVGLFAQAFSMIYFVPTLLLFDLYVLQGRNRSDRSYKLRWLTFSAAAVLFAAMFLTHGSTGLVFAMTVLAYVALSEILTATDDSRVRRLGTSLLKTAFGLGTGLLLVAFWIIPYLRLSQLANREGVAGEFALHQIPYLDLLAMVGLGPAPQEWIMWALGFASTVAIFAAVGAVLGVRKNRTVAVWAILAFSFALFTAMPGIWIGLVATFQKLWGYLYVRALIPTMIFLPALAGYGVVELSRRVVMLPGQVVRTLRSGRPEGGSKDGLGRLLQSAIVAVLAISVAYVGFIFLRRSPADNEFYPGYGPMHGVGESVLEFSGSQISLARTPSFTISPTGYEAADQIMPSIEQSLGLSSGPRIDVSPYLGGFLQILPLYTEASTINIYAYGASLIHAMWGYQQGAFFSDEFGSPHEIDELARWLGIEYVFLNTVSDPLYKYDAKRWPIVTLPPETLSDSFQVRRFAESTGMASVLSGPTVLVIGGVEHGAYEQVFKVLNSGALNYREGIAIEGSHYIDDYEVDELNKFDAVILHGYGYKDSDRAWEILDDYVSYGGSLFVDTGWQYVSPEWESEHLPEVLPATRLDWQPSPTNGQFVIVNKGFAQGIEPDEFAPMIWRGQPWGLSSPTAGLRDWANPILTLASIPIVAAGEYGDGRVVWSGMNAFSHIRTYESEAEVMFLGSLIDWLLEGGTSMEMDPPIYVREEPDIIHFTVEAPLQENTYLLWREAHSPDWNATGTVNGESYELPIYRAGPGMMLIPLPRIEEGTVEIELKYGFGWIGGIGKVISVVTLLTLPFLWPSATRVSNWLRTNALNRKRKPKQGRVAWLDETESFVEMTINNTETELTNRDRTQES